MGGGGREGEGGREQDGERWRDAKKLGRLWGIKTERERLSKGDQRVSMDHGSLKADLGRWKDKESEGKGTEWKMRGKTKKRVDEERKKERQKYRHCVQKR